VSGTLDLVAQQIAIAQRTVIVCANVGNGIDLALYIAHSHVLIPHLDDL
jgi:hypothetical protein